MVRSIEKVGVRFMILKEENWKGIPLIHVVKESLINEDIPVVIFLHGFKSAKEHNLHYAINLAKKNIRVIMPDAHLHGERVETLDTVQLGLRFWETVLTSIEELGLIHAELQERSFLKKAKIGVSGTSMGGITSLGALAMYDWIDAAAIMMGTPGFVELAKAQIEEYERGGFEVPLTNEELDVLFESLSMLDLTKYPSALGKRPIHFWHGMKDEVVPYKPAKRFYESILDHYRDVPERISFTTDKGAGHVVSREAMLEAVEKIASHLNE